MKTTIHEKVAALPPALQRALASVGYRCKDIPISVRESCSVQAMGGDGYRSFVVIVNMASGEYRTSYGSWGGANMFNPRNAVDLDDSLHVIPKDGAVIHGSEGGTSGVYATIDISPANAALMLPAKASIDERDAKILGAMRYKPGAYRQGEIARAGGTAADIDRLVAGGFIKRNRAGACTLTTEGKNAAAR